MISTLAVSGMIALNIFATPYIAQTDPVSAIRAFEESSEKLDKIREQREEKVESIEQVRRERNIQVQNKMNLMTDRFESIIDKWSIHWTNVLFRLEQILVKLDTKAVELEVEIDTSKASDAIDLAQVAVDEFAAFDYTFEYDDELTAGENMKSLIATFKEDAKATREAVLEAKKEVQAVFAQLRESNSQNSNQEGNDE